MHAPAENLDEVQILYSIANKFAEVINKLENVDHLEYVADMKSNLMADAYRETAYGYIQLERKILPAFQNFCKSLRYAETNHAISKTYWMRAELLYQVGLLEECLEDIKRLLALGIQLSEEDEAKLKKLEDKARAEIPYIESYSKQGQVSQIPEEMKHPNIHSAANCLRLELRLPWERSVVANRDIEVGELIASEEPFSCGIYIESYLHCHQCMKSTLTPIPCSSCTQVQFCSDKCLTEAWEKFHQTECKLLKSLAPVLNRRYAEFRALISLRDYRDCTISKMLDDQYASNRIMEILNLKTYYNDDPYNFRVHSCQMDAMQIYYIIKQHSSYLDCCCNNNLRDDIFKGLLYRLMLSGEVNRHRAPIVEYVNEKAILKYHWDGLYAFYSMFNHSCNPNVSVAFYGSTVHLRALTRILAGTQLYIHYCRCTYFSYDTEQRQEILRNEYSFQCNCNACALGWNRPPSPLKLKFIPDVLVFATYLQNLYSEALQVNTVGNKLNLVYLKLKQMYIERLQLQGHYFVPPFELYLYQRAMLMTVDLYARRCEILSDILVTYNQERFYILIDEEIGCLHYYW